MKVATLCSGIGAPERAALDVGGLDLLWYAEVDPFCISVMAAHHPALPNLGDIMDDRFVERARRAGVPDLVIAGTPCQSFSIAGGRGGLADDRGNLTLRFCEIVEALNVKWFLWENVPGVLSSGDNAFGRFLGELSGAGQPLEHERWASAGVVVGPRRTIVWRTLDAQYFGLAQRRARVFAVGSSDPRACPPEILFEFEGVRGDSPPGRGARADVAHSIRGRSNSSHREDVETFVPMTVGPLTARYDSSEDGTGRGLPLVFENHGQDSRVKECEDILPQINARAGTGGMNLPLVLDNNIPTQDPARTLNSSQNRIDLDTETFIVNARQSPYPIKNKSPVLGVSSRDHALFENMGVRRLMPVECERLMGFPDNYTLVEYRGKPAADGPRYRVLGNSIAVPVIGWILKRLKERIGR